MKRLHFALALILVLTVFIAMPSAAAEEPSIGKLPAGWLERKPYDESIERYFIYQEKAVTMAELLIFEEELAAPMSAWEYLEAVKINGLPNFANYAPVEDVAATLHGREMLIHRFNFSNQQGVLKAEAYVFVMDTTGYLLLFDTSQAWFPGMQPKFAQFVNEAVILPAPPAPATPTAPVAGPAQDTIKPEAAPAGEPEKPAEVTGGDLPAFDEEEDEEGGLPQFEDEDEGFFSAAGWEIFITLPEGAEETARSEEGVKLTGPDGSRIAIALYEDFETAAKETAKLNEGLRKHNTSAIKCGEIAAEATLYSGDEGGVKIAVLAAQWEGTGGSVIITLPRDSYSAAGNWIKEMLCSVKLAKK